MAITLAPSRVTEERTSSPTARYNGVGHSICKPFYQPRWDAPDHGRYVSKEEYWAKWYEAEPSYEWNNGYLEAKPMPNRAQALLFQWFLDLLRQYAHAQQSIDLLFHEVGFSMTIPDPDDPAALKEVVRKPDIGVIRHDNAILWGDEERSYAGLCDLCIESLSDSDKGEVERDTKIKKSEYEFAGVREYYILDPTDKHMHFYQRTATGVYMEMQPDAEGIIRSQTLPGFQFRRSDLKRQPSLEELALDPVYQGYVLLQYQAVAKAAAQERQRAKRQQQRAEQERQRAERYAAMLRELGVVVDEE